MVLQSITAYMQRLVKSLSPVRILSAVLICLIILVVNLVGNHYARNNQAPANNTNLYATAVATNSWKLKKIATHHQIEGYVSLASVKQNSFLGFHISCTAGSFTTDIYRMGWYAGRGAGLLKHLAAHKCKQRNIPKPSNETGSVDAGWPTDFNLHIPANWQPGIYLAKLTSSDGYQNYVPFTIRSSYAGAKYLFIHAINTDNAYNLWGGNSLYSGYTPALKIGRAVEASLNRPFLMPNGGDDGSGNFLTWEYPMIKFLEKNGYKVDYATDIDIHEHPSILLKYKAIIIAGHDEYWSREMLNGYKAAVSHDVNLAVFAANTAYRPVRFTSKDRVMINYKSASLDPFTKTNPKYSTPTSWKVFPLWQPESELLGISYANETGDKGMVSGNLVVNDVSSWIFKGTELKKGDAVSGLVGYEYDKLRADMPHPANVDILFHSPIVNYGGQPDFADASYYKAPSGAGVFDAGTFEWSWGLDPAKSTYSPALVQVTKNILTRFGQ